MRVLEVGCGEGGVLKAFLARGCTGTGIELSAERAEMARQFLAEDIHAAQARIITASIYEASLSQELHQRFDLIVLKDVVEHIPDQLRLLRQLKGFLRPQGLMFFGFPPWQMPFGGHQQICRNPWAARLPYCHLLPRPLYRALLRLAGESAATINNLMEVKATGISIEQFERYVRQAGLQVYARRLYLINPIYSYKFGWKPRRQFGWLSRLPYLRNFLTTAAFYVIGGASEP